MTREEIEKMRRSPIKIKSRERKEKSYDVRISQHGCSDGNRKGMKLNYLLHRCARKAFQDVDRVEITSVEKMPNRIYFIPRKEKKKSNYQITRNSGWSFQVTARPEEEKIYRLKWINKEYELKYDADCGLYYIENNG